MAVTTTDGVGKLMSMGWDDVGFFFLESKIRSMNLGINGHVAHFNSWSIESYKEFEKEGFDSIKKHTKYIFRVSLD